MEKCRRQQRGRLMTEARAPRPQGHPGLPATVGLQTLAFDILFLNSLIEHDVLACLRDVRDEALLVGIDVYL